MNEKTTESERLREIVNFIMNGGKVATGEGRKNLQQTGIEMIEEYCERHSKSEDE
jgi:hypothetical protein